MLNKTKIISALLLSSISVHALAMSALEGEVKIQNGKNIVLNMAANCTNCWWSESASITGTVELQGTTNNTFQINTSVPVISGKYTTKTLNLLTIDNPMQYQNAKVKITMTGANTPNAYINTTLPVRSSYQSYQNEVVEQNQRENQYRALLRSSNPQVMYLAAGKYERNGNNSTAQEIYDKIINRFPNSPYAIKSSDRLNEMNNITRANNNASEAKERSYQLCKAQVKTCVASCPKSSYGYPDIPCAAECEAVRCN